jgi:tetratricopeptide (TPR) repeat protein
MIAKKVEAAFNPTDECLCGVLLKTEHPQHLVDDLHRTAKLPACRREDENVVHEATVEQSQLGGRRIERISRAALFFAHILKDAETADAIIDQALAVNPNLSDALRCRGWISVYLGRHEPALEQFHYAIWLNPLDPGIYGAEAGLGSANFFLRRFEIALSWATKSMARRKNYIPAARVAMTSYAMLGRIADAQMMQARMLEAGVTFAQTKKYMQFQRQEDVELYLEAYRIAGMPE